MTTAMLNVHRLGKGSLKWPAAPEATLKRFWCHALSRRPVGQTHRLAIKGEQMITRRVPLLFGVGRPSAIVRGIALTVVGALYRMLGGWSRTHVRQERIEVEPSVAETSSNGPVTLEIRFRWRQAARLDAKPNTEFRGSAPADRRTMCSAPVCAEAAATLNLSSIEVIAADDAIVAARAQAVPCGHSLLAPFSRKNSQSIENLASQILEVVRCHWMNCLMANRVWGPQ